MSKKFSSLGYLQVYIRLCCFHTVWSKDNFRAEFILIHLEFLLDSASALLILSTPSLSVSSMSTPMAPPQVDRIVDKRKNKKGKWEYLIRWKGYGSNEDTWEPEHHLQHCEEFIHQFNALHIHKYRRPKQSKHSGGAPRLLSRTPTGETARGRGEQRKRKKPGAPGPTKQKKIGATNKQVADRVTKAMTYRSTPGGLQFVSVRKPHNGLQNGDLDAPAFGNATTGHKIPSDAVDGVLELNVSETPLVNELGKVSSCCI